MALSKSTRIIILLVIDTAFFFLELITGYAVHSLALVADSFHMLNDVLSLCVGLWAVKMASKDSKDTPKMYTYGYQRAETLGALVNGVFLVALCVTIFLDAIARFVEPQEVSQPVLVLVVGCLGLASNLVGLVLFHDHGHSHGGHSHGGHSHSHGNKISDAEEGHAHASHDHGHAHDESGHNHAAGHTHAHKHSESSVENFPFSPKSARSGKRVEIADVEGTTVAGSPEISPRATRRRHSRTGSRNVDFDGPKSFRNSIIQQANNQLDSLEDDEIAAGEAGHVEHDEEGHDHGVSSPLIAGQSNGYGAITSSANHQAHRHAQEKPAGKGGHSHGDLNMQGIFLHVMGDALGNIGVIVTAIIIWKTDYSWRFYFDPAISLVITVIILCSAIPLCKAASRILLQAVPQGIEVDDIKYDIEELDGVQECHHLHVWQLSDEKLIASLHVKVDFTFKGDGSARYMILARQIRECLHEYGIHSSTIQPEFGGLDASTQDLGASSSSPTAIASAQRTNSDAGNSCLLDCGDDCEGNKSCCPPSASQTLPPAASSDGHGHSH
jgi:zinc transporter 1